jgi:hypothetical protein
LKPSHSVLNAILFLDGFLLVIHGITVLLAQAKRTSSSALLALIAMLVDPGALLCKHKFFEPPFILL